MTPFYLSDAFIERLGWVLLHSVWQFALIALVVMVFERATRRFSAGVRYGAFLLAFGAMAVAPAATCLVIPGESKLPEVTPLANEVAQQEQVDKPPSPDALTPIPQPGTEIL